MAIAFDAAASVDGGTSNPATLSTLTIAAGSDRYLLVGVSYYDASGEPRTVSGVTWNSVAMSLVKSQRVGAGTTTDIWGLVAPDTGAHDAVVTFTGAVRNAVHAMSLTGVDQSTPTGTAASATGTSNALTVDVTSAANELVYDVATQRNGDGNTLTVGAGQTQRTNTLGGAGAGSNSVVGASSTEAGAASVTMSWTGTSGDEWTTCAVPVKPVAVAATHIAVNLAQSPQWQTLVSM